MLFKTNAWEIWWRIKKFRYFLFSDRFKDIYIIVEEIIQCLSEEQLEFLEINSDGKIISFRDQMLIKHFYSYPRAENLETLRKIIKSFITENNFVFELGHKGGVREFFMEKLGNELFLNNNSYFFEIYSKNNVREYKKDLSGKNFDYNDEHIDIVKFFINNMNPKYLDLLYINFGGEMWSFYEQLRNRFLDMGLKFSKSETKKKIKKIIKESSWIFEKSRNKGKISFKDKNKFLNKVDELLIETSKNYKLFFTSLRCALFLLPALTIFAHILDI